MSGNKKSVLFFDWHYGEEKMNLNYDVCPVCQQLHHPGHEGAWEWAVPLHGSGPCHACLREWADEEKSLKLRLTEAIGCSDRVTDAELINYIVRLERAVEVAKYEQKNRSPDQVARLVEQYLPEKPKGADV